MNGESGWVHYGSFFDEDGVVVVELEIVIFFGDSRKDSVCRGIHSLALHDCCLDVRTLFEVIIGKLANILEAAYFFL